MRHLARAVFCALLLTFGAAAMPAPVARAATIPAVITVPSNQLSGLSSDVSTSTGITASVGAVRDTGVTNTTRSSGGGSWQLPTASACPYTGSDPLVSPQSPVDSGSGLCSNSGGSGITTYQVPVTAGQNYTFKFYLLSDAEPRGQATVFAAAYNSGGSAINSWNCVYVGPTLTCNNQFWSDNAVNSKAGAWEETPEYIPVPSGYGIAYITLTIVRYLPNSSASTKLWVDDLYFGDGFVHEEETPAKTPFNGSKFTIDANGAFQRKTSAGAWVDWFPMCMATANLRGNDWSIYANNGWNCAWAVPTTSLQNLYWNGSGYSSTNWSTTSGNTPPAIAKRAVNSEFTPDGMLINVDVQSAVRGNLVWTSSEPTYATQAIDNLYANGYGSQVFAWMRDAEWNQSLYERMRAVWSLIDAKDKANNGGVRAHPVITNVGLPGNARAYTSGDGTGALRTDYVGAYSGNLGPHKQLTEMPGNKAPGGYCQIQSGLGWAFRAIVYRCLGEGGHMISFWADNGGAGFGSYPLDGTSGGSPYEPWFYYGDSVYIAREINTLLPLLKTAVPTNWSVASSNSNVSAWPRTNAAGEPNLIIANNTTSSQTVTFTLTGVTGFAGSITNTITGATVTPTSSTSSTITMTIPGLAAASSAGNGGGTMVLRLAGASTTGATTTTAAATTSTTTPSSGETDDQHASFAYSSVTGDESTGWHSYSGGEGVGDYASTNHTTCYAGSSVTITWAGTDAVVTGAKGRYYGIVAVKVDGATTGDSPVDLYDSSAVSIRHTTIASASGLSPGTHTIELTLTGTPNASALGNCLVVDSIVASGATATTTTSTTIAPASAEQAYSPTLATPGSFGSGSAVTTGVRVNVACSGTLTGVWWYRSASDTGTINVGAWTTAGVSVASGASDPTAGGGWRYVPFTTPLSVTAGSSYIVGLHHPTGVYPYTYGTSSGTGFNARTLSSAHGCLVLPADSSAHQGLYEYGASLAFPTQTYQASDYWLSPQWSGASSLTTLCSGPCLPWVSDAATTALGAGALAAAWVYRRRRRRN